MSEELQAALTKLIEGLMTTAEKAGQVGQEQLPLVIQEYLAWGFWEATVMFGVFLVPMCVCLWIGQSIRRTPGGRCLTDDCRDNPCTEHLRSRDFFGVIVFRGIAIVLFLAGSSYLLTLLKITIAPRVYLIDQLRGML